MSGKGNRASTIVPDVPPAVVKAFTCKGKMDLADYIQLDDHTVTEFLKASVHSSDDALARLATGLLDRKLFKAHDVTDADDASRIEFHNAATTLLAKKGLVSVTKYF